MPETEGGLTLREAAKSFDEVPTKQFTGKRVAEVLRLAADAYEAAAPQPE